MSLGEKEPFIRISKSEPTVPTGPQILESSVPSWFLLMSFKIFSQYKSTGSLSNGEAFFCYLILVFCFKLQDLKLLGYSAKYFSFFSQARKGHRPLKLVL